MHREEDEQRQAAVTRNEKQRVDCTEIQQSLQLLTTKLRSYCCYNLSLHKTAV